MAAQIGRVLGGRYQLVEPLGQGRSAQAFLADDVRLQRRVTVKLLHPRLAGDEELLRRFRSEAHAAAALSHPHVLAVYDWGEDQDGIPWLVTEHLGGGSLRGLLDRGHRLTPSQALSVGLQAARGLAHAHAEGVVHRDVRPANLLFGDDGRLRVADFGLARALAEAASSEPSEVVATTARYASPEQAQGAPLTDRADVYSLALTMVESVTGEVPFSRDTTLGTLMARLDRRLDVPDALGPLAGPVASAAEPDPDDRLGAAALAAALVQVAPRLPRPGAIPLPGPADIAPDPDGTSAGSDGPPSRSAGREASEDRTRAWRPPGDPEDVPAADPDVDRTRPLGDAAPRGPQGGAVDPTVPVAGGGRPSAGTARPPGPVEQLDPTRVGGPTAAPGRPDDGDGDEDDGEEDGDDDDWDDGDGWDPRSPTGRRRRWPRRIAALLAVGVVVTVLVLLVADLVGAGSVGG